MELHEGRRFCFDSVPDSISSTYFVEGRVDYLPDLTFGVSSFYELGIDRESDAGEVLLHLSEGMRDRKTRRGWLGEFERIFGLKDLFFLRRIAMNLRLFTLVRTGRGTLDLGLSSLDEGFCLYYNDATHGSIGARMDLTHPDAQGVIQRYWDVVGRIDDVGRVSGRYKAKLHNPIVDGLNDLFFREGLDLVSSQA